MTTLNHSYWKNTYIFILLVLLLFVTLGLRSNIGRYSYGKDEAYTLLYIKEGKNTFSRDFILNIDRPPLHYQLVQTLSLLGVDIKNELLMRAPFVLAGSAAVLLLYSYLYKMTGNHFASFSGSLLYSVNGFTVGLSKIVQYQAFIMIFSIAGVLSAYLYSKNRNLFWLLGSILSLIVGFYFHWDIVFVVPIVILYVMKNINLRHYALSGLLIVPLVIFYIIPYVVNSADNGSGSYLLSRIGLSGFNLTERLQVYEYMFELYNPFIFTYLFLSVVLLAFLIIRKHFRETLWFFVTILIFILFIKVPGTHIYNLIFPMSVVFGLLISSVIEKFHHAGYGFSILPVMTTLMFLTYQSYLIFYDLRVEYPLEQETIYKELKTRTYDNESYSRYMIGFPIDRMFKQANRELLNMYPDYSEYTFTTNENSKIAQVYLDLKPEDSAKMFIFSVKNPSNFVYDNRFKQYKNKQEILILKDGLGNTRNTIYTRVVVD